MILLGKTNFALSHFQNALHVTIRQDFGKLGPSKFQYDGIVIDDIPLSKWDVEEVIQLVDTSYDTSVNVKYDTGVIPENAKIIICANDISNIINNDWNPSRVVAVMRRLDINIFDDTPLWKGNRKDQEEIAKANISYYKKGKFVKKIDRFE